MSEIRIDEISPIIKIEEAPKVGITMAGVGPTTKEVEVIQKTNPWTVSGSVSVSNLGQIHVTTSGIQEVTQGTNPWTVSGTVTIPTLPTRKPAYTIVASGIAAPEETYKTIMGIEPTSKPVLVTEIGVGVNGGEGFLTIEIVRGTNATNPPGTNSTSFVPRQIRTNERLEAINAASNAATNWTSEPTVLEIIKEIGPLAMPSDPIIIQFGWTRELLATNTISNLKFIGIRCKSTKAATVYGYIEWEEHL